MAEFKLGRIRFVWKNDWAASTTYYRDDVVAYGGKIYICVIGHSSAADFFTDLDIVPSKWNLVSDGQTWKGEWTTNTRYVYDDIVKYGARLYICNTIHTSAATTADGLELDLAKWDAFAEGLDWKGNWATNTTYRINDFVKYGGHTYRCNTKHTSAATESLGLENDLAKWDPLNEGLEFVGPWTSAYRYKTGDIVKDGGNLYVANQGHTSAGDFGTDAAKWDSLVQGIQFEDEWNALGSYQAGDIVRWGGNQYIAKVAHSGVIPTSDPATWDLFNEGFNFKGDWGDDSSAQDYRVGDVVRYSGYTYLCIQDHTDQEPPNTSYWEKLNAGLNWKGVWVDDQQYYLGDIIRYGSNTYVCILGHISEGDDGSSLGGAANSRPDLDTTATYWNIFTIGAEEAVLIQKGDLIYQGDSGPTRLPIGREGQVLKVSEDLIPEWAFLGVADDVYYVAETGTDLPAPIHGKTLDKPWRSIRYACEQVERGAKNQNAAKLLELNRLFIQREITTWTDYQITNDIAPFTSAFTYDTVLCERDMGLIVDALIWDITHGGNVRSREAALEYVNNASGVYTYEQEAETVASINYGLSLIEKVLNQEAPSANYQTLAGDNSSAVVPQIFREDLTAESVLTEITGLVEIITDAITAGTTLNIPQRIERTSLIRVATGRYQEVLPIIVPRETCVMGDELRATNVQPRKSTNATLVPKRDVSFSYTGIDRIEQIIGDIVTGSTVTPTSGNTQTQYATYPFGDTDEETAATALARALKRDVDFRIGDKLESSLALIDDAVDTEDAYARNLLLTNKEFIKDEIVAYLTDAYPNLKYSRTKCKQDTGYIIDAIAYDLTYGGNWQTVNAGEAYYAGTTLNIATSEKTATLAAYNYLKTIVASVARSLTLNPKYSTAIQINGTAGDATSVTRIQGLIDNIRTIISDGSGSVAISYPSITGASAGLQSDHSDLGNAKSTIQETIIDWINSNFGSFTYDSAKCRRDTGILVEGAAYDIALGTNYNAIRNGISYTRAYANEVYDGQLVETSGAILYAGTLVEDLLSDSTAISRNTAYWNEVVDILENGTTSTATPGDGVVNAIVWTDPGVSVNKRYAREQLQTNRAFIISELTSWIASNYPALSYNITTCQRDTGYIIDAVSYDVQYGGNSASVEAAKAYFEGAVSILPSGQKAATAAAFAELASICSQIVTETYSGQDTSGTAASGTEATEVDGLIQIIEDVITADTTSGLPSTTYPDYTWATTAIDSDADDVLADTTVVPATLQYITDTYNDFKYIHAKCSRDIGYIIDAVRYDFCLGTNFASIVAAQSYLRAPSNKVVGDQKEATIAANTYAKALAETYLSEASAIAQNTSTWQTVNDFIFLGSNEGSNRVVETGPNPFAAVKQLEMNKDFIVAEVLAYVDNYFKTDITETSSTGNVITVSSTAWMRPGMILRVQLPIGGLNTNTDYYVADILSSTTVTVSATLGGSLLTLSTATSPAGTTFIAAAYVDTVTGYNRELCSRDVTAYIDAFKWDMLYPQEYIRSYPNSVRVVLPAYYKTSLSARYYANSVLGSQEEDFYYLRNNTGLRLHTLEGLQGDLGPANEYGTSRPTAGAYASLDPGWGPDDQRVWITARSPYVQNITTFGTAATGQRIDGALHNGGNDSIVSNDFTQVISDGIGAHILNNGRAELVSVFTYYAHIGYLAESGGRIRATNGNNSYGTFGSVAEGVDPEETPVTAIVDNRLQYNAVVSNVLTNTVSLLQMEYGHAGNEYSKAVLDIFGAGSGESLEYTPTDFRNDGVFQVQLLDLNDSSGTIGGSGYLVASNTAQTGSTSSITLAATDGQPDNAYPGMKVLIISGAGVGQYGIIDTYNSGTKLAAVIKESDGSSGWDHIVPGTPIVSVTGSSVYRIEPAIEFTAPSNSTSAITLSRTATWDDIVYGQVTQSFTNQAADSTTNRGTGATFDITTVGQKVYVSVNQKGTNYRRLEVLTFDADTLAPASNNNATAITLTVTAVDNNGGIVAVEAEGSAFGGTFVAADAENLSYSLNGTDWTNATLPGTAPGVTSFAHGMLDDGSTLLDQSIFVAVGSSSGTASQAWYSSDGISWTSTTIPGGPINSAPHVAFGNNLFVCVFEGSADTWTSNDGVNWTRNTSALTTTGWAFTAYGQGKFVVLDNGTDQAKYSTDGVTWTAADLPATLNWAGLAHGNNRFIAIAQGSDATAFSLDGGATWIAGGTLPASTTVTDIAFGNGAFVVTNSTNNNVYYSEYGLTWSTQAIGNTTGAVVYGDPGWDGKHIILSSGSTNAGDILKVGVRARGRASVANEQLFEIRITEPGANYATAPTITITDPNNIFDGAYVARLGNGVLAQPSFIARGNSFLQASAEIDDNLSNGYADFFQTGSFVAVRRMSERPVNGSNVVFSDKPNTVYKLVNVVSFLGSIDGTYTGFLQLSPNVETTEVADDGVDVTMRIRYSQVRLTGHDFLDIGTGNFITSNYPGIPLIDPDPDNETQASNGGRVFYTATDQDGNFRVGDLFSVEQATGVATLNADAFNIAGLQELSLGEVTLGGNSASVTEFSTDPFFTANSDSVVPTQRAIKAYIEAQIGGGGASLVVNTVTAGDIFIGTNQITTVSESEINIRAKVNFTGGVVGLPIAYNYFLR